MKRPTAQLGGARMKCNGDSLFPSLSLSLIHAYMCLTVGRRSRVLRSLSRDRSVTFHKNFSDCLKRLKTLFDSRPTVAWPPTTVAWPFSDFFQKISNCLKRAKTSFDCRPTVAWHPTTVAWPFSEFLEKKFIIARNVQKTLFDSRPTVAWPPTTVAWPFSDLFQKFSKLLETFKNVVWQ